ncbi:MAG: hypothetical protein ACRDDW_01670 [Candidatus Rhabdochlamydia sp.]
MSIKILEKSINSLIYELPHGKPNPYQEACIGQDNRERIKQKSQTTFSCQYYALNYLRHRIGKYPCEDLEQARAIEKICSLRRKAMLAVDGPMVTILESITGTRNVEENTPEEKMQMMQFFIEHQDWNNTKELVDFIHQEQLESYMKINIEFFESLKVDIKEIFESEITFENGYIDEWSDFEQLSAKKKSIMLNSFAFIIMAEKYGLKKSPWKPSDNIESLIKELDKNGPLAMGGVFGRSTYLDAPFCLKQRIENRDVYAWKPGAKRVKTASAHMCLIVGAKKVLDKEYIYFIDPQDSSDPDNESSQKLYLSSYKNFISRSIDLHGRAYSEEVGSQGIVEAPIESKAGYAYYGYKLLHA